MAAETGSYRDFGRHLKDFLHEFALAKKRGLALASLLSGEPSRLAEQFEEGKICDAFIAATADYLSRVNGIHTPAWALKEDRVLDKPWFSEDWREVRLSEKLIVVGAENAKTAARRLVPISDNLAAFLTPHTKRFGSLNPCDEQAENVGNALGNRFERAAARAKVAWKRNGFRHSYISYRVATLKDVPAVALECGNSPQVIFSNYRALATDAEAKAWFSILPPKPAENVVPLKIAANG